MADKAPFQLGVAARQKVDEILAGLQAVRDKDFEIFFIDGKDVPVTLDNVDEVERAFRAHFAPHYPEIAQL